MLPLLLLNTNMQSVTVPHSNTFTPVFLEKIDRVSTRRLTIDGHEGHNYFQGSGGAACSSKSSPFDL